MTDSPDDLPAKHLTPDDHLAAICTVENFKMALRALKFYADPYTYRGAKIVTGNPPCEFAKDMSDINVLFESSKGTMDGSTIKVIPFPGKLARTTLRELLEYESATDPV